MDKADAKQVVLDFWQQMQRNDWAAASQLLAEDFVGHWPQSAEKIVGRDNFVQINANYPVQGRWEFTIHQVVADGNKVVTDVSVTDGDLHARAITFSTVVDRLITEQTEFWPDSMPAAAWRRQWVEIE